LTVLKRHQYGRLQPFDQRKSLPKIRNFLNLTAGHGHALGACGS
jgi:hypothetical protein